MCANAFVKSLQDVTGRKSRHICTNIRQVVYRSSADVDKAPKRKASDFKVPDLNTLGADLFMPGEVTRQQLFFPSKTELIVSAENPGAGRLAQETNS